jgi:uncharacterized protein
MKKLLGILLILALSVVSVSALAEGNTVTAIGSGSVTLVPDMAAFTVGITTQDVLITTAQSTNAAAMQAVIDSLVALGVAREDIQTENYSVYPVYDYSGSSPVVTGYEVSNTVTVIVRDLANLPTLLDGAVGAGANNVYSLNFQSSEQNAAYDQALKAAAQDALRKASLMAQAIGMEAGDILSLTENSNASVFYTKADSYALSSSMATPIENGQITVTAEVSAVVVLK